MIILLLALLQGDVSSGELIRNEDPALQIRLPKEYKALSKEGIPPDIYDQFPSRYVRKRRSHQARRVPKFASVSSRTAEW